MEQFAEGDALSQGTDSGFASPLELNTGVDWSTLSPDQILRAIALENAVAVVGSVASSVADTARQFYLFLVETATPTPPFHLTGTAGPVKTQPVTKEPDLSMQLVDNQYFVLTIAEADSKGVPVTTDTLTWTPTDPTIVTVDHTVSPSSYVAAIVAGVPGQTDVVVTDGTVSFTEHVTVVPGGVATMSAAEGPALTQPVVPVP
jgi:hypothetical protein